jgi:Holliday junction resolvasome RuvABC DNA-binding subunit
MKPWKSLLDFMNQELNAIDKADDLPEIKVIIKYAGLFNKVQDKIKKFEAEEEYEKCEKEKLQLDNAKLKCISTLAAMGYTVESVEEYLKEVEEYNKEEEK